MEVPEEGVVETASGGGVEVEVEADRDQDGGEV